MLTYEFMKHCLVAGAFGIMVGAVIGSWVFWICELVSFIRKKVKAHRDKATASVSDTM